MYLQAAVLSGCGAHILCEDHLSTNHYLCISSRLQQESSGSRRPTGHAQSVGYCKLMRIIYALLKCACLYLQSKGSPGVYHYEAHADSVTDLALSSCRALPSSHILSASKDGTLRFVDLERGVLDLVS